MEIVFFFNCPRALFPFSLPVFVLLGGSWCPHLGFVLDRKSVWSRGIILEALPSYWAARLRECWVSAPHLAAQALLPSGSHVVFFSFVLPSWPSTTACCASTLLTSTLLPVFLDLSVCLRPLFYCSLWSWPDGLGNLCLLGVRTTLGIQMIWIEFESWFNHLLWEFRQVSQCLWWVCVLISTMRVTPISLEYWGVRRDDIWRHLRG